MHNKQAKPITAARTSRAAAIVVAVIACGTVAALAGCASASPTYYPIDPALNKLPTITADEALSAALPAALQSHTVAAATSDGPSFVVALNQGKCAVAIRHNGRVDAMTARAPRSSDEPVTEPSSSAVARALGPATSVSGTSAASNITMWCGQRGAAVTVHATGPFRTEGAISLTSTRSDETIFTVTADITKQ